MAKLTKEQINERVLNKIAQNLQNNKKARANNKPDFNSKIVSVDEHFVVNYGSKERMMKDALTLMTRGFDPNVDKDNNYIEIMGSNCKPEISKKICEYLGIKYYDIYDLKRDKAIYYFSLAHDIPKEDTIKIFNSHQSWEEDIIEYIEDDDFDPNKIEPVQYTPKEFRNTVIHWFGKLNFRTRRVIQRYASEYNLNIYNLLEVLSSHQTWVDDIKGDYRVDDDSEGTYNALDLFNIVNNVLSDEEKKEIYEKYTLTKYTGRRMFDLWINSLNEEQADTLAKRILDDQNKYDIYIHVKQYK